jgi:hypothetical protein
MMPVLRNPKHAFDAADDSAGNATDHTADHRTDRTGRVFTLGRAALAAAHNPLGLGGKRQRNNRKNANSRHPSDSHRQTPCFG